MDHYLLAPLQFLLIISHLNKTYLFPIKSHTSTLPLYKLRSCQSLVLKQIVVTISIELPMICSATQLCHKLLPHHKIYYLPLLQSPIIKMTWQMIILCISILSSLNGLNGILIPLDVITWHHISSMVNIKYYSMK